MATPNDSPTPEHQPYISDEAGKTMPEFTIRSLILGTVLGIIFGASSLYLLLKVGMTVSASVPIAVLSITLFTQMSKLIGSRRATILENNVVQTAGSAGESIAFGVGVTMPALLLLGFEMDITRVMTVSILGSVLGILMMIPLRRAFIVKQHGMLKYPEGVACAEVLKAGETGGTTAKMVFLGFFVAFFHKFLSAGMKFWADEPSKNLYSLGADGSKIGLKGAAISGELSPELLGVGYLIGPKVAGLMMAGAVLSYFVLGPAIATFGDKATEPIPPGTTLISKMDPGQIKGSYLRYIGAGAVAAGGIISMCRALPLILGSILSGLRDLKGGAGARKNLRTETDMPMSYVLLGSLGLVAALMAIPSLGLGFGFTGLLGAVMILLFGFLFVTVSSRLTGEVGSSSNPISGMTIATILLVCLIFWVLGQTGTSAMLTALTIAAVVCIASSNGGTTSQDLKTGYLVGATPVYQQWAIVIGAVASAIVIGLTMLMLNSAGVHYTKKELPTVALKIPADASTEKVGRPYADKDQAEYKVVHVRPGEISGVPEGRYLVDAQGKVAYRTDLPIAQKDKIMDNGEPAPKAFAAPQPQLFTSLIEGILGGKLEWGMVIIGILIAISLELAGIRALPFAVGMYLPLGSTTPIFAGGVIRWLCDLFARRSAEESENETSSGILLSSGFIAGGTLCALLIAMFNFLPDGFMKAINFGPTLYGSKEFEDANSYKLISLGAFLVLALILFAVGSRKNKPAVTAATKEA